MGLLKKISKMALIYSITYFGLKSCASVVKAQPISELENKVQTMQEYKQTTDYEFNR